MDGGPGEDVENPAESSAAALAPAGASEDSCGSFDGKPGNPAVHASPISAPPPTDDGVNCPTPVNPRNDDIPLNLSLKVSFSIRPSAQAGSALVPVACRFCTYKTVYPEVLVMHERLVHKDKPAEKSGFVRGVKQKRLTGCPPALEGKDVAPLPMFGGRHPRRTKSPLRPAVQPQEKLPVTPPLPPKTSPVRAPLHDVQETQHQRRICDGPPRPQPSRYAELPRKPVLERPGPPDRAPAPAPASERPYPARKGVIWHSDAARLCLSSQFGPLPPMDFGEPSSKRLKYVVAPCREADAGVFRGPVGGSSSRLLIPGRGVKPAPASAENPAPPKATAAMGGGLDSDWNMMNFLSSYSPNDLASLYHSAPPPPAHAGLANPRAGRR